MTYELVRNKNDMRNIEVNGSLIEKQWLCQFEQQLWLEHTGMMAYLMPQCLTDMRNMLQDIAENERLS